MLCWSWEQFAGGGGSREWFAVAWPLATIASQQAGPGSLGDGAIELHAWVRHRQPLCVHAADQPAHGLGSGKGEGAAGDDARLQLLIGQGAGKSLQQGVLPLIDLLRLGNVGLLLTELEKFHRDPEHGCSRSEHRALTTADVLHAPGSEQHQADHCDGGAADGKGEQSVFLIEVKKVQSAKAVNFPHQPFQLFPQP